jgi:hypothetical protein
MEGNIKINLEEVGCVVVDWIALDVSQDGSKWRAAASPIINLWIP